MMIGAVRTRQFGQLLVRGKLQLHVEDQDSLATLSLLEWRVSGQNSLWSSVGKEVGDANFFKVKLSVLSRRIITLIFGPICTKTLGHQL